jgi:hypothetical protein
MANRTSVFMQSASGEVFETSHPEYHKDSVQITPQSKGKEMYRQQIIANLRGILEKNNTRTVYVSLRSCSSSGMSRVLRLYVVDDGCIRDITYQACVITGYTQTDDGLRIGGCGMDMGFAAVYDLSRSVFAGGFGGMAYKNDKAHRRAKSAADARMLIQRGFTFKRARNGDVSGWDTDGGYALSHSWI